MLWYTGSGLLVLWLIVRFGFHRGGIIHVILIAAISLFIVQFAQDRRTRDYEQSLRKK